MIELQLVNYVIEKKSIALLNQHKISQEYFVTYSAEAEFIFNHVEQYKTVPDKETFLNKFNDFDLFVVSESEKYLIETIQEQHMYNQMVPFVNAINVMVTEDSEGAIKYARDEIERMSKINTKFAKGYDIIKNAPDRGKEYKMRLEADGLLGITTGIPEFDEITHGWLPGEELVVIVGRTNEGKTWVLLFFLVAAWLSGKKVLLYSGEMPKDIVGFRVDTLSQHFRHTGLTVGSEDLGDGKGPDDYIKYLNDISNDPNLPAFIVVTPKDLDGRLTVPMLHELIEYYEPDIVGLDQLSLMDDARSSGNQPERIRFTHVSEDLYNTSEKYGVPILTPSQASREAAGKNDENEDTPELHQISESDGIGQNATRVIGMRQLNNTLKLTVRKSRYSKKGDEILVLWDIDMGIIKPFLHVQMDGNHNVTATHTIEERPRPNNQNDYNNSAPSLSGAELF